VLYGCRMGNDMAGEPFTFQTERARPAGGSMASCRGQENTLMMMDHVSKALFLEVQELTLASLRSNRQRAAAGLCFCQL